MKDILGFEDKYAVTEDGRVWRKPRMVERPRSGNVKVEGKWMTPQKTPTGYHMVRLCMGKRKANVTKYVHRLVAEAFLDKPDNTVEVNHIDGIKGNNHVSNLEWVSHSDNIKHAHINHLVRKTSEFHCLVSPSEDVVATSNLGMFCVQNELDEPAIRRVLKGKRSQHKGWRAYT